MQKFGWIGRVLGHPSQVTPRNSVLFNIDSLLLGLLYEIIIWWWERIFYCFIMLNEVVTGLDFPLTAMYKVNQLEGGQYAGTWHFPFSFPHKISHWKCYIRPIMYHTIASSYSLLFNFSEFLTINTAFFLYLFVLFSCCCVGNVLWSSNATTVNVSLVQLFEESSKLFGFNSFMFFNFVRRLELLSFAVVHCSPDMIESILRAKQLLQTQVHKMMMMTLAFSDIQTMGLNLEEICTLKLQKPQIL